MIKNVTSTDFQNSAGRYLDDSGRSPVFITRYNRPVRVLIDINEYEKLKSYEEKIKEADMIEEDKKLIDDVIESDLEVLKYLADK